jgi:glutaminyl-tRNA synthetase
LAELWGPKTDADEASLKDVKKQVNVFAEQRKAEIHEKEAPKGSFLHKQFEARELDSAVNSEALLQQHRTATNNTPVVTRFPPEPNGYLHIGHAKAMNLSFGYAKEMGGYTILRFDDTNPEAEDPHYFEAIKEMVGWLGHKPAKITATSDYFDQMHEFAIRLIKEGKAYVDFSPKEEIKRQRDNMEDSPYRNTPVDVNLREFENMRKGKYAEGQVVLRVKIDMKHPNPNMRDFLAYRIKYHAHARTGDKWCIYPTYDFSHCLVDSLEWITHSLCTLEFEIRRDSYYWLLQALDLYRPHVWEFSRLNVTRSMLSKRKVEAIRQFCFDIGVSRTANVIPIERLEQCLRVDLDERVDRAFAVLEPLRVIVEDLPADAIEYCEAPVHPRKTERGVRRLPITRVMYIDRKDFREIDDPDFFGMAPNKEVGLRYAPFQVLVTGYKKDETTGEVTEITVRRVQSAVRPKGFIHWLAQVKPGVDPMKAEIRLYDYLFRDTPTDDNWLELLDRNSEHVLKNAFVETSTFENRPENWQVYNSKFQFERLGYFSVDKDCTSDNLVLNRAVTLKEGYKTSK